MSFSDVTSFLQSVSVASAIVGTLGVTSLAISLYERYTVAKENKRERFERLVLTTDFFVQLSEFWRLHDICRAALEVRERGRSVIMIGGKIVRLTDLTRLETEFVDLCRHTVATSGKVKEGGAFFLAPTKIRQPLGELAVFIETADLNRVDSHFLETFAIKLGKLSQLLRKEVGLE